LRRSRLSSKGVAEAGLRRRRSCLPARRVQNGRFRKRRIGGASFKGMARRDNTRRKTARRLRARPRRPAVAWLAALAFILQIGLSAAPAAAASPGERAAAALSAAVGQQVPLCAETGHAGAPDHSPPCCGDCALCGLACGLALLAPPSIAQRVEPQRGVALRFSWRDGTAAPPVFFSAARPRGPPSLR